MCSTTIGYSTSSYTSVPTKEQELVITLTLPSPIPDSKFVKKANKLKKQIIGWIIKESEIFINEK